MQGFCEPPGAGPGDDAGIDAPMLVTDAMSGDGPVCYRPTGWRVCLDAAATGQVQLPAALDTDKSSLCLAKQPASWTVAQPAACIVVGDTVTVGTVSDTGTWPLVIVAQTSGRRERPPRNAGRDINGAWVR
jgi:hypothetical protein